MKEVEMIAVVALRRGLYLGAVYEAGERFTVPESLMTAKKDAEGHPVAPRWFEPVVDAPAADEAKKKQKGK
jgi:hypothetical protein